MTPNLLKLRRLAIDLLDRAILRLLNARARQAAAIGRLKGGQPCWRPEREAQVLRRAQAGPGLLVPAHREQIFREIISACRALESRFTVACPPGISAQAARILFGAGCQVQVLASTDQVLAVLAADQAACAVVPVGGPALTGLLQWPVQANGETQVAGQRFLVLGRRPLTATGQDRTLLAVPAGQAPPSPWLWHWPSVNPVLGAVAGCLGAPRADADYRVLGVYPAPLT